MSQNTQISLFIPCLVDQVYPEMGMAMVRVLRKLGFDVRYHKEQTCCGQPAFNAGYPDESRKVARHFLDVFQHDEAIVCPSGSCTAMVRQFYPELFEGQPEADVAVETGNKVFEFSEFLIAQLQERSLQGRFSGRVSFHNSCHSYRELRIKRGPLTLMQQINGYELIMPDGEPVCCGFGGLFSFKFAPIAASMATTRLETFADLDVDTLVSNDPGCIMHMRQEAREKGFEMNIMHLAEFLDQALQNAE
ncbi:MAG: (Fe-S)-binding protein [Deferribacteres bacterium]|nr:(Fe-S)-binding protein [candidate division KSB1 bacterium]MCB9509796.1 (Fe-S)-binding protein [Deferribacteres bacterium]